MTGLDPDAVAPCGLTWREIERRVAESRAAQGLPRYIESRAYYDTLAASILAARRDHGGGA